VGAKLLPVKLKKEMYGFDSSFRTKRMVVQMLHLVMNYYEQLQRLKKGTLWPDKFYQ
jgi:hypothetical protein